MDKIDKYRWVGGQCLAEYNKDNILFRPDQVIITDGNQTTETIVCDAGEMTRHSVKDRTFTITRKDNNIVWNTDAKVCWECGRWGPKKCWALDLLRKAT